MKKSLLLIVLMFYNVIAFAQKERVKINYMDLEIELSSERNDSDELYIYITNNNAADEVNNSARIKIKPDSSESSFVTDVTTAIKKLTSTDPVINDNTLKVQSTIEEYYKKIFNKDDYKFLRNIEANGTIYEVKIKPNNEEKFFNLKICKQTSSGIDCKTTIKTRYDIERAPFVAVVKNFIKSQFDTLATDILIKDYELQLLYDDCKKYSEKALVAEVKKEFQDTLSSLIKKIENLDPQYAGLLKLNKKVRVYKRKEPKTLFDKFIHNVYFYSGFKNLTSKIDSSYVVQDTEFNIKYATIHIFNNKAKQVVIVGYIKNNDKNIEFVTINHTYSIPIRAFNNTKEYVPISPNDNDANKYYINYNDVFDYYPSERTYNYSVRNNDYRLQAGDSIKIEQRKLADYFTAVIFSDFLGLNSNNANSLLQAEGRIKIPMFSSNNRGFSPFSALRADINATIYNGFDDNARFITPVNAPNGMSTTILTSLTINNFDYLKFNNVNAGITVDFINFELKNFASEVSFGYGLRYLRAGTKYSVQTDGNDLIKQYQLNALCHEITGNLEIRPQMNFGADLNASFMWINSRGSVDDVPINYAKNTNNDDKSVLKIVLNLYSKLDPDASNDGIYARLGGYYHLGQKDFFPQIMVGYATNLSSFVNKFKKK